MGRQESYIQRSTPVPRLVAILCLAAVPALARDSGIAELRDPLFRIQTEVGNLENSLAVNRIDVGNMVAQVRYFPLERRLLDADLFFETKDYEKSATLYRDLVDNPAFAGSPGYWRTVYKLGESLFRLRNYQSARKYFQMAASPAAGPAYADALGRLFEIAVQTRDFSDCEKYEAVMNSVVQAPESLYSYGKYLYHRNRRTQAAEAFARLAPGMSAYARAQYFLGVIDATSGKLDSALSRFATAAAQAKDDEPDVRGNAILAQARMLYELARYEEALGRLGQVDAKSPVFPDSLYDSAWVYLKLNQLERAAHALDILLMMSPTGETLLRAGALRGRILSRLNDSDGAAEAYADVSATLGPVTTELDRISSDPKALDAYFGWIVDRDVTNFKLDLPISERTAKWLESDAEMGSIVGMFRDIAREREDVRSSFETVEKLLWALRSGGKLDMFPALKDKDLRLTELESRFVDAASQAADLVRRDVRAHLPPDQASRYDEAVKASAAAAALLKGAPRKFEDFVGREHKATGQYKELERQLFLIESLLRMQRQQVLAIEEWLKEEKFKDTGTPMTPDREKQIRVQLDEIKGSLSGLNDDARAIREAFEREAVSNGAIADAMRVEDAGRRGLLAALLREADVLADVEAKLPAGIAESARQTVVLIRRAAVGSGAVDPLLRQLADVADRGAAEFEATVLREKSRLETSVNELQKAEMDGRQFAATEGALVFKAVKDRLSGVLLEADLGLVDMAWQREQVISDKLREIGLDKTEKMKGIEAMSEMLKTASAPAPSGQGPEGQGEQPAQPEQPAQ